MTPVAVYTVAMGFQLETFSYRTLGIMITICLGVSVASAGELLWNTLGVVIQLLSVLFEALRLNLVQILIQRQVGPPGRHPAAICVPADAPISNSADVASSSTPSRPSTT